MLLEKVNRRMNTKLKENTENYILGIFKTAKYCLLKTV